MEENLDRPSHPQDTCASDVKRCSEAEHTNDLRVGNTSQTLIFQVLGKRNPTATRRMVVEGVEVVPEGDVIAKLSASAGPSSGRANGATVPVIRVTVSNSPTYPPESVLPK